MMLIWVIALAIICIGLLIWNRDLVKQRQLYRNAMSHRDGTLSHIRRLKDNIPICQRPTEWNEFVRVDPYVKGVQSCTFCDVTIKQWNKMKV